MNNEKTFRDSFLRTIALVGLLLVLLLGAWGIILLAFNLSTIVGTVGGSIVNLFGSTPTTPAATITVTAPQTVKTGSSFSLSWEENNTADIPNTYMISYACQNGLSLKVPTASGQYQAVPCATPFNFVKASGKMTLIPMLNGTAPTVATLTVSANRASDNVVVASGSTNVTVTPAAVSTGSNSGTNTGTNTGDTGSTYYPATRTTNLYGFGDLAVRMLAATPVGTQSYGQAGRVNVQFEITNIGTNIVSSGWAFNATLPVGYAYTYNSPVQQALYPGDRIVYTLGFDRGQYNTNYPQPYNNYSTCYHYDGYQNTPYPCDLGTDYSQYNYNSGYPNNYGTSYNTSLVTIVADPQNRTYDYNRGNNTASISVPYASY